MSKNLLIEPILEGTGAGLFTIRWEGGGRRPKELDGMFTSHDTAERAIKLFQARATHGLKEVGKSRNKSRA